MLTFLMIIGVIVGILLILIILIQNPKGGGLASNMSAGTQLFGVKRTTDLVEKLTWGLAGFIIVISIIASSYNPDLSEATNKQNEIGTDPQLQEAIESQTLPSSPQNFNKPAPSGTEQQQQGTENPVGQ